MNGWNQPEQLFRPRADHNTHLRLDLPSWWVASSDKSVSSGKSQVDHQRPTSTTSATTSEWHVHLPTWIDLFRTRLTDEPCSICPPTEMHRKVSPIDSRKRYGRQRREPPKLFCVLSSTCLASVRLAFTEKSFKQLDRRQRCNHCILPRTQREGSFRESWKRLDMTTPAAN